MRIAVGALYFEHALRQVEDRDVVGATPQVEDRDRLLLLLLHAVRQRCGGGLVDDAENIEPRDLAGILCGLSLRVVEVGWDRHDCLGHCVTEVILRGLSHFLQHHGGDFRRCVLLALNFDYRQIVLA